MSAYSETVNVIMKSRVRESRTHGSVRGWHREVPVYSTMEKEYEKFFYARASFSDIRNR